MESTFIEVFVWAMNERIGEVEYAQSNLLHFNATFGSTLSNTYCRGNHSEDEHPRDN